MTGIPTAISPASSVPHLSLHWRGLVEITGPNTFSSMMQNETRAWDRDKAWGHPSIASIMIFLTRDCISFYDPLAAGGALQLCLVTASDSHFVEVSNNVLLLRVMT